MTAFPVLFTAFSRMKKKAGKRAGVGTDASPVHFCPQCGQLTGGSAQSVVAPLARDFRAAGVLVPASAGVPRNLVVPCGSFVIKIR